MKPNYHFKRIQTIVSTKWLKQLLTLIVGIVSIGAFPVSTQLPLFSSILASAEATPPSHPGLLSQAMGGSLKVSNGTNRDAYVKLIEPNFQQLVSAFFVKSNSSYTVNSIPDGTYRVLFALGKNWNPKTQSFSQNKSFAKFDKPLNFTTTQLGNEIRYKVFQITLHPVVGGKAKTSGVNEQEFKRY